MGKVRSIILRVDDKQLSSVEKLARSADMAPAAFIAGAIADWLDKPKKFRRFATKYLKSRKRAAKKAAAKQAKLRKKKPQGKAAAKAPVRRPTKAPPAKASVPQPVAAAPAAEPAAT